MCLGIKSVGSYMITSMLAYLPLVNMAIILEIKFEFALSLRESRINTLKISSNQYDYQ